MRCYADNPIIQTEYTVDPDTVINDARGFFTQKTVSARNPVIFADVPDMSIVRVGDAYYMSSTTIHMSPGVPIMKSKDLIDWQIVLFRLSGNVTITPIIISGQLQRERVISD
jgi:beta-xylosidase